MSIGTCQETTFAAMTARPTLPREGIPAGATEETSRAPRKTRARLHPVTRWKMALAYALGVKVEAIGAEYGLCGRHVSQIARRFGLPLRGHAPQPVNPADAEHLRRWARRRAAALRREADEWAAIAELE